MKIHKRSVAIAGIITFSAGNFRPLFVREQKNVPYIWFLADVDAEKEKTIVLETRMTGEDSPESFNAEGKLTSKGEYLGSFFLDDGNYVGHVWNVSNDY